MIAQVVPIRRLPRKVQWFDYAIPNDQPVSLGELVRIPFRNKQVYGIVWKIKDRSEYAKIKPLEGGLGLLFLSETERTYVDWLSTSLFQSRGSMLHAAVPTFPKRFPAIESRAEEDHKIQPAQTFAYLGNQNSREDLSSYLSEDHPVHVMCPTVRQAQELSDALEIEHVLITSEQTPKQRLTRWLKWRQNTVSILVCSPLGALLSHPKGAKHILFNSSHQGFSQNMSNPRFDARICVKKLAHIQQSSLCALGVAPRPSDVGYEHVQPELKLGQVVDQRKEKRHAQHPMISYTVEQALEGLLSDTRAILVLNRKGHARRLMCQDCKHLFPCTICQAPSFVTGSHLQCVSCGQQAQIPSACPSCQSVRFARLGFGIDAVVSALQELFPNKTVGVCTATRKEQLDATLLVSTDAFIEQHDSLSHPDPSIALVVHLDADAALTHPGFGSMDRFVAHVRSWQLVAHRSNAAFIVQTKDPDLVSLALQNPSLLIKQEADTRRDYLQPPFAKWIELSLRAGVQHPEKQLHSIKQSAASIGIPVRLDPHNKHKFTLLAPLQLPSELSMLLSGLPDDVLIDTQLFL